MRFAIVFSVCSMVALAASPACANRTSVDPAASSASQGGLPDRDPELARRLVAEGALLLDVRTPQEFQALAGTAFSTVSGEVLSGVTRIPSSFWLMRMSGPRLAGDGLLPAVTSAQS